MGDRICSIGECDNPSRTRGWCAKHYARWFKYGDPLFLVPYANRDHERFWAKVDKNGPSPSARPDLGPCWIWTGAGTAKGYGCFRLGRERRNIGAHRWAYREVKGPIPEGLHLDHLCRTPQCVNPDHLEPVTPAENQWRGESPGARVRRTGCCIKGHSLEDAYQSADGRRYCRTCNLEKQATERRDPSSSRSRLNLPAKYRQLSKSQVAEIRELVATGLTQREVAERFGCSQPTISAIVNGRRDGQSFLT